MSEQLLKGMLNYSNLENNPEIKADIMKFTLVFEDISIEYDYTLN